MKVLFSGSRDLNHSSAGGYHKITDINLPKKILWLDQFPFSQKKNKLLHIPLILLELQTNLLKNKFDIVHFFYGDVTKYHFIPFKKTRKTKSIITLHLNIDHKKRFQKRFVKMLREFDGIIVLSSQQQNYLKAKYNLNSVFIPHGFSEPQFSYKVPKDLNGNIINLNKINITIIGENYRDYNLVKIILDSRLKDDIQFHLVGTPKQYKDILGKYNNVSIYPRISNDEYFTLISVSDYNFLPVTFATANNTLLEAQFLNTPSILPKIEGITDYAAPEPYNIFYKNVGDLITNLNSLNKTPKEIYLSNFTKNNFDWNIIYRRILDFYENLKGSS